MVKHFKRTYDLLENIEVEFEKQGIKVNMHQNLPKYLYRYNGISDYLLNDLENDKIALTYPTTFNDSLDSFFSIESDETMLNEYEEVRNMMAKVLPDYNYPKEPFLNSLKKRNKTYETFARNSLLIKCFTKKIDNEVMWSSYANLHTGICVKYSTNHKLFNNAFPVIYGDKNFILKDVVKTETDEDVSQALVMSSIYKSSQWSYEKEWRVIFPSSMFSTPIIPTSEDQQHFDVIIGKPSEIILGNNFFDDQDRWSKTTQTKKESDGETNNEFDNLLSLFRVISTKDIAVSKFRYESRQPIKVSFDADTFYTYLIKYENNEISIDKLLDVAHKLVQ